jgi:hypothetical protein
MAIIRIKLDYDKIDAARLFKSEKGRRYLDITLLENRGGTDAYGNDFMAIQDLGKQAREKGERGPILGNAKFVGQKSQGAQPAPTRAAPPPVQSTATADDSVPF